MKMYLKASTFSLNPLLFMDFHALPAQGMALQPQAWISSLRHGFQASGMDFKPQAWI